MNKKLGNFQSVQNFRGKNGEVKNQFVIYTDKYDVHGNRPIRGTVR